jgi:hypothetical protein
MYNSTKFLNKTHQILVLVQYNCKINTTKSSIVLLPTDLSHPTQHITQNLQPFSQLAISRPLSSSIKPPPLYPGTHYTYCGKIHRRCQMKTLIIRTPKSIPTTHVDDVDPSTQLIFTWHKNEFGKLDYNSTYSKWYIHPISQKIVPGRVFCFHTTPQEAINTALRRGAFVYTFDNFTEAAQWIWEFEEAH